MLRSQGDIFLPFQPLITYGLTDYSEMQYYEHDAMVFYQFELRDRDITVTIVPDCCVDILFECDKDKTIAMINGSVLKGEVFTCKAGRKYFGVRILPCSCFKVFGTPIQAFINKQIPLVDFLPAIRPMIDQITPESDLNDIINIIKTMIFLNESAGNGQLPLFIKHTLKRIIELNGNIRLEQLADENGYSARHFSKVFQDYIGINPKLFCRIIRFQYSLEQLLTRKSFRLSEVVTKVHYYDKSHMVRDYHDFCQSTPSKLIKNTLGKTRKAN